MDDTCHGLPQDTNPYPPFAAITTTERRNDPNQKGNSNKKKGKRRQNNQNNNNNAHREERAPLYPTSMKGAEGREKRWGLEACTHHTLTHPCKNYLEPREKAEEKRQGSRKGRGELKERIKIHFILTCTAQTEKQDGGEKYITQNYKR